MIRFLLVVGLFAAAAGCRKGEQETEIVPKVPVGILTVTTDTLTDAVPVVGRLSPTPGGSALLTAPAPGVVSKVLVQVDCAGHGLMWEGCTGARCDDGDPDDGVVAPL